jgi:hypothetical protein
LAAVTPQSANVGIDDLAAAVRAAQDEMLVAVQRGGLVNDPLRYVLSAVSAGLGAIFQIFAASAEHYRDVSGEIDRQTRDAVARAQLEIEQKEAQSIHAIAGAIASAAEQALTRRVHLLDRKIACAAAGALFGVTVLSFAGGFWWGRESAAANAAHTEAGLEIAFRDGSAAANTWLRLMQANDVQQELQSCASEWTDPKSGRRACYMPIWLDPPHNAAPQR